MYPVLFVLTAASFALVVGTAWSAKWRDTLACTAMSNRSRPVLAMFLLSFAFSLVNSIGIGRTGSNVNYLLELFVTTSVLSGIMLGVMMQYVLHSNPEKQRVLLRSLLTLALVLCCFGQVVFGYPSNIFIYGTDVVVEKQILARQLAGIKGDILAHDPILYVLAGKRMLIEPHIAFALEAQGKLDLSRLRTMLVDGSIGAVVSERSNKSKYPNDVDLIIRKYYVEFCETKHFVILLNRSDLSRVTAEAPETCS